jgi:hypothetical protein
MEGRTSMVSPGCDDVRSWLTQREQAPPPAELCEHVAACPNCRGALALLLASQALPETAIACDEADELLAAFVEYERASGAMAAAQRYPDVWWHLWTCSECAQTYAIMSTLVAAAESAALPALPLLARLAAPQRPALPRLRLARDFLHALFGPHLALGNAWGPGDDAPLIAEAAADGYHISVHVRVATTDGWDVIVLVAPPMTGQALLTCGELMLRATLNERGEGLIRAVPLELLAGAEGPELLVAIEPHVVPS